MPEHFKVDCIPCIVLYTCALLYLYLWHIIIILNQFGAFVSELYWQHTRPLAISVDFIFSAFSPSMMMTMMTTIIIISYINDKNNNNERPSTIYTGCLQHRNALTLWCCKRVLLTIRDVKKFEFKFEDCRILNVFFRIWYLLYSLNLNLWFRAVFNYTAVNMPIQCATRTLPKWMKQNKPELLEVMHNKTEITSFSCN